MSNAKHIGGQPESRADSGWPFLISTTTEAFMGIIKTLFIEKSEEISSVVTTLEHIIQQLEALEAFDSVEELKEVCNVLDTISSQVLGGE